MYKQIALHSVLDYQLEIRLKADEPIEDETLILGKRSCLAHLNTYFLPLRAASEACGFIHEVHKQDRGGARPKDTTLEIDTPGVGQSPARDSEDKNRGDKILERQSLEVDPMLYAELISYHGGSASEARDYVHETRRQNQGRARPEGTKEETCTYDVERNADRGEGSNKGDKRVTLDALPLEILASICSYLPFKTLCRLGTLTKKLQSVVKMDQFWENIHLPAVELSAGMLGDVLTSNKRFLNVSYCKMGGDAKDLNDLERRLIVTKPKLRGLCLSGFSGMDSFVARAVGLSPNLTVLDVSFSRISLVHAIARELHFNNEIKSLTVGTIPYMRYEDVTNELLHDTITMLVDKCLHLADLILHGVDLSSEMIRYLCKNIPSTMVSLDLARNCIENEDVGLLVQRCPDLQYIDLSGSISS